MGVVLVNCLTCQLGDEIGLVITEAIIDLDDIIVLFETKIGEGDVYVLLIVTNDRPHTVKVVGVCLWEHGGSEAIVIAEITTATTGTLEGDRGEEGHYETVD